MAEPDETSDVRIAAMKSSSCAVRPLKSLQSTSTCELAQLRELGGSPDAVDQMARLILLQQKRQHRKRRAKLAKSSYEEGQEMARFFIEPDQDFTGDSEERLQERALAMYLDSVAAQAIIKYSPQRDLLEIRDDTTAVIAAPVESPEARKRSLEDHEFCMHLDKVAADYMKNAKLPRLLAAGYGGQKKVRATSAPSTDSYAEVLRCIGETNEPNISEDEEDETENCEAMNESAVKENAQEKEDKVDQSAVKENAQEETEKNEEQACDDEENVQFHIET